MKKILILTTVLVMLLSFGVTMEAKGDDSASTSENFQSTMMNMQSLAVACATLYKEYDHTTTAQSVQEFLKEIPGVWKAGKKIDIDAKAKKLGHELKKKEKREIDDKHANIAKEIIEAISKPKNKAELDSADFAENDALLKEIISTLVLEEDTKNYIDEETGKIKNKLRLQDAWGNDLQLKSDQGTWFIGSGGSDGTFNGFDVAAEEYQHVDASGNDSSNGKDIIFSGAKGFILGPKK